MKISKQFLSVLFPMVAFSNMNANATASTCEKAKESNAKKIIVLEGAQRFNYHPDSNDFTEDDGIIDGNYEAAIVTSKADKQGHSFMLINAFDTSGRFVYSLIWVSANDILPL
ncbi:MAG: hypothetical protein ACXVCY_11395 [Pseudobdellovibrionaceae bacterium]